MMSAFQRFSIVVPALAAAVLAATACAPVPPPAPYLPSAPSSAFSLQAFGWSTAAGHNGVDGRVTFRRDDIAFACTGNVALTPDTPYTRARFNTLYGSTTQAAVPEAIVRARTVSDPNADYRSFVRPTTCTEGRFSYDGLPDGSWFLIVPVSAGGDRIVLMRRIETRGGRTLSVTL